MEPDQNQKRPVLREAGAEKEHEMDVYEIITERIINLLEREIVPWRRPWTARGLPRNLVRKPYRGVNYFLLSATKYVSSFWLGMKPANQLWRPPP
jgi:antirestriction protein ArdC